MKLCDTQWNCESWEVCGHYMQEILFKIRYFERGLPKSPKLILFFLSSPVPFNGQSYQKQKGSGTSDQPLFRLENKFSKIPLLVICCMTIFDDIYNIKLFFSYSKTYICKFMQVNSWHHTLFHFHLFFWIWKVWKGRGKNTKIWISWEWKDLFRWNKKHFS